MTTFQVTEGVHGIDVGLFDDGVTAVYLFDDDDPTLVDAGTAAGAERILAGLRECGVDPSELENLVLSHVHTDHSGAASALVDAAPELDVYIHELTAPHLIDPTALVESSRQAMGEQFSLMGAQGPVPEENVVRVGGEGATLDVGENSLELVHVPGHSPDHLAVWNPERRLLFAAECLGVHLERADRWLPPGTLPNFDVGLLEEAIERLRAFEPEHVVFPHFGVWPHDPAEAFEVAETELHRFDERVRELHAETGSVEETKATVAAELVDTTPAYDPVVERFYASLITDGYLRYHGLE
jgi:glyoxylase-like metal-dependent hydrolase (beta-lactamase superfamily II)